MDERKDFSCNNYKDLGKNPVNATICVNCGWSKGAHHTWSRKRRPNGSLGQGWSCSKCGRTAYDNHGRCTPESPPEDYPPCSTFF